MPFLTKLANTFRGLAMDAIQRANSGHPGAPMGLADAAAVLTTRFLKVCPSRPDWPDRDRFVLSAGHASMLLYGMLHVMGYDLSLEDIRQFRQWDSRTPGHPECDVTPGVETTTGPLGQGIANAVGMALAERMLAARFNRTDREIVSHTTWVFAGDGCMMEGVASEAASMAGTLGLGKLVVLYDANGITIDGGTDLTFREDVGRRFEAMGWHVQEVDGHDHDALEIAFVNAKEETARPSLVVAKTHIAFGSPAKQDSSSSHGAPLGVDEIRATKENLGWPVEPEFLVPDDVHDFFAKRNRTMTKEADWWDMKMAEVEKDDPDLFAEWKRFQDGEVPDPLPLPEFPAGEAVATRKASGACLSAIADAVPFLVGGSADLAGSNNTDFPGNEVVTPSNFAARTIRFGVREHAMGAMANGMALHGGFRPLVATFLVFSDYMRPTLRLAALMDQPVVSVFTHDSIWVGEDGPTHQPVEHVAALRAIPSLVVLRPGDATETAVAWDVAMRHTDGPTALILTRQGLPTLDRNEVASADGLRRGAYVLAGGDDDPEIVLMASGSEVSLALEAGRALRSDGVKARVVSMPSFELFEAQDEAYRESVLPAACTKRVAVEAGIRQGWDRYLGLAGKFIGIERFGASAPGAVVAEKFGLTAERVLAAAREFGSR
ncbi:MAG: transketolase [Planctomycetota bacterium]